jgi:hypothetical protein
MARKINALKLPPEVRGQSEVTNHRFVSQVVPYLLPPHLHPVKIAPQKRRPQIAIEVEMRSEISGPVKIIHTV